MIRFSASRLAFFDTEIHAEIPDDAVPVTPVRHAQLLAAQAEGHRIGVDGKGRPRIEKADRSVEALCERAARLVKSEARRRITAIAGNDRQSNDNAALALAALQITNSGATEVDLSGPLDRRRSIDALRLRSNELEDRLGKLSAAQLATFDPADDKHWSIG